MVFYSLRQRVHRARLDAACREILDTPPLPRRRSGPRVVTKLCHADVLMYLVAAKSFVRRLGGAVVVILDDGTLTDGDRELLERHVRPVEIVPPVRAPGPNWDILLHLAERSREAYQIQLDSDTVTLGSIPEVVLAVAAGRAFTLGTSMGRAIEPATVVAPRMRRYPPTHVQVLAEQHLDRLPRAHERRYVRGNSGLAGFPQGSLTPEAAEAWLEEMSRTVGPRWRERGTFQMSSNYFVANTPGAEVLPWPKYQTYSAEHPHDGSVFLHFIGTYRFHGGVYRRSVHDAAAQIRAAAG